jgi:RNA polymerase-binding transcription factor DksA
VGRQETLAGQIAEERHAIRMRLKRMAHHTNGFPQVQPSSSNARGDVVDKAQQEVLERQESRAYELLVSRVKALDRAWESLRRGTYGVCHRCGEQIPHRRLEAVIDTLFCFPCQEKVDALHGTPRPLRSGRTNRTKGDSDDGMAHE